MQQNHCDGVLSNDWNTLLGGQISQHTAMSMSRSALAYLVESTSLMDLLVEIDDEDEDEEAYHLQTIYQGMCFVYTFTHIQTFSYFRKKILNIY